VDEDAYGLFARGWYRAGYTIIGGCCGTTPGHIRRAAEMLHGA
jgi:S-methylmethionine-dependent homocysteine/selenocysteine methylase